MPYEVYHSQHFDRELLKQSKTFNTWLEKIQDQIVQNPYVGDQLRVPWCREKKFEKFRVYYLIYEETKTVYFVAISDKNDQQKVINTIFLLLENFQEEIKILIQKKTT